MLYKYHHTHLTSPHPYLTSPRLTSPHLASPHLTPPHLTTPTSGAQKTLFLPHGPGSVTELQANLRSGLMNQLDKPVDMKR